ncbi:alpha/beta fold hydrolase [Ureibacillus acetophenoni]|uniref:Pimeloyl-ACP methyl ester carboxylesterase n=1 Tax=Ureibacillus acetophenoni TaxID=614649 RepID=A0A285U2J2_9BACL|nr:alpha/beta hydrolase [Ureibacillus acetophenoni]SOC36052.1 pimeloyl-ACP methyl ester carboxylesterase [Ureibacillus acetophenoni]
MKINTFGDEKNPTILFLHGGGVGGWMWEEQVRYFQRDYFLLIPELPLSNSHFKIQHTAIELNKFIDENLENRKIILVGFSIGAQICISMIGNSLSKIQAAMINSPLVVPINNRLMDISLKYSYPLTRSRLFAKLQASSMGIPEHLFNTYFEESLLLSKDAFLNMMKENMCFEVPNSFYETKIPLLYTIGSKEQKIVKQSFERLKNNSLNANGFIFEKVAHNSPFKASAQFNQILEKWLIEVQAK